ncbi:EF-hand domain-containing protein [Pararhizobium sp. LjRoot238]|uniref:EF-hand domain-containing protein n=1 Tax=Pararhizobium sp. LjRoot238 TaxID=3342293 RepID=UPI003ED01A4E
MTSRKLACMAIVATLISASTTTTTFGQTAPAEGQDAQSESSETMPGTMMGRHGMMGGMRGGAMRGHMMKIMFAVADVDGDGALSFEEVTTIHKRIFDKVDANKDGKVTTEEMQAFMRDQ